MDKNLILGFSFDASDLFNVNAGKRKEILGSGVPFLLGRKMAPGTMKAHLRSDRIIVDSHIIKCPFKSLEISQVQTEVSYLCKDAPTNPRLRWQSFNGGMVNKDYLDLEYTRTILTDTLKSWLCYFKAVFGAESQGPDESVVKVTDGFEKFGRFFCSTNLHAAVTKRFGYPPSI